MSEQEPGTREGHVDVGTRGPDQPSSVGRLPRDPSQADTTRLDNRHVRQRQDQRSQAGLDGRRLQMHIHAPPLGKRSRQTRAPSTYRNSAQRLHPKLWVHDLGPLHGAAIAPTKGRHEQPQPDKQGTRHPFRRTRPPRRPNTGPCDGLGQHYAHASSIHAPRDVRAGGPRHDCPEAIRGRSGCSTPSAGLLGAASVSLRQSVPKADAPSCGSAQRRFLGARLATTRVTRPKASSARGQLRTGWEYDPHPLPRRGA